MLERREEERRDVNLSGSLKLMGVINGPAEICDVSPSGLKLKSSFLFARLSSAALGELIGHSLKISIPKEDLFLEGALVRVGDDCLGMQVHSTTNAVLWHNLCANHVS